ncbi:MAG: DoxX family protein [Nitrospirae bacterium]|nr:MAG: DoxX family protein [Nitrospirota bacterium]
MLTSLIETKGNLSALLLRLGLAVVFFPHGVQKVLGWFSGLGFSKTIEVFTTKLHFPLALVLLLMAIEFLGSISLIVGFLTRIWAFGIGAAMTVCALMNHIQHGFFMNWFGQQKGEGIEFHILVVAMAVALIILGGGSLSVDALLIKRRKI